MAHLIPTNPNEIPEHLRPAQQAMERAVKQAFLTGQAYDPDGKGYAYWKGEADGQLLASTRKAK